MAVNVISSFVIVPCLVVLPIPASSPLLGIFQNAIAKTQQEKEKNDIILAGNFELRDRVMANFLKVRNLKNDWNVAQENKPFIQAAVDLNKAEAEFQAQKKLCDQIEEKLNSYQIGAAIANGQIEKLNSNQLKYCQNLLDPFKREYGKKLETVEREVQNNYLEKIRVEQLRIITNTAIRDANVRLVEINKQIENCKNEKFFEEQLEKIRIKWKEELTKQQGLWFNDQLKSTHSIHPQIREQVQKNWEKLHKQIKDIEVQKQAQANLKKEKAELESALKIHESTVNSMNQKLTLLKILGTQAEDNVKNLRETIATIARLY